MDHRLRSSILFLILGLFLSVALLSLDFGSAQASPLASIPGKGLLQTTPVPADSLETPTQVPAPEPTATPAPNPISQILHIINFDASDSLLSAWTRVMQKAQDKALEDLEPVLEDAARQAAAGFLRFSSRGLEGLDTPEGESSFLGAVKDLWSGVFSVAVLLFPLAVLMNIAAVMIAGVSVPVARAEMLEALIRSLLILGVSAGSFLLSGTMIKIAWGAAEVVSSQQASGSGNYLEELFIRLVLAALDTGSLESMLSLFLSLTLLFLALMAISALILSYFAVLTLTVALVALAPLLIVLGSLPHFRWIYATWLRAFTAVLLIPLANAILFRMWLVFNIQAANLIDILVALGFICIIVTINFYVGKLIFSPALEAGKMAFDSMVKLFQIAAVVVGLAAGGAGLGAAGGTIGGLGAAGRTPLPSGPGGSGTLGENVATNGHGDGAFSAFQGRVREWRQRSSEDRQAALAGIEQASSQVRSAGQIAQALAGRDPLLRAVGGAWMNARQANLAHERAAIQSAREQEALEVRQNTPTTSGIQSTGSPITYRSRTHGLSSETNPNSINTGSLASPVTDGLYPILFGNPAYDDNLLQARGWNPTFRKGLHRNIQGLEHAARAAALQGGLLDGQVIYDPLINDEVRVSAGTDQASSVRVTPELFRAAAVRISSGWLSQENAGVRLAGASILERQTAEEVLQEVGDRMPSEPLGTLSQAILAAGQEDPGNLAPGEFWERVVNRFHRGQL